MRAIEPPYTYAVGRLVIELRLWEAEELFADGRIT